MPVKHTKVTGVADGGNTSLVRPSDWNADHSFFHTVTSLSANTSLDATHEDVLATAGAGGITLTLPTAAAITGKRYFVKRVDSAAGNVTIATTASQTVDADPSYVLVNQYQFVEVMSNGSNWLVVGGN